jgi:hypothetical protein
VPRVVYRLDACEQLLVEEDLVLGRGQPRRDALLDLLQPGIGVRPRQPVEDHLNVCKRLSAALQRDDRVVERRCRGIVGDVPDLLTLLPQRLIKCRKKIGVVDLVERRRVERKRRRLEQRVVCRRGAGPLGRVLS